MEQKIITVRGIFAESFKKGNIEEENYPSIQKFLDEGYTVASVNQSIIENGPAYLITFVLERKKPLRNAPIPAGSF